MPLRRLGMQMAAVQKPLPPPVYDAQESTVYEETGEKIPVVIQPLTGTAKAAMYGVETVRMRLMLTTNRKKLEPGMLVCPEGEERYVICEPAERWRSHQTAVLKQMQATNGREGNDVGGLG